MQSVEWRECCEDEYYSFLILDVSIDSYIWSTCHAAPLVNSIMGSVCSEIPELPELVEGVVCPSDQVEVGCVKEVDLAGHKVLLVRSGEGEVRALGASCTHYGAPLVKGSYDGVETVRCPWHGACFNTGTGDIEDFPGLDSLASHAVEERDGNIVVTADKRELVTGRRHLKVSEITEDSEEMILIVGGGAAGHTAAETLRKEGYTGRVIILTAETSLPYDRPKLSKNMAVKLEEITLRKSGWYEKAKIDVRKGVRVVAVDSMDKKVSLDDGSSMEYSKLMLCTGGTPRRLGVPGEDLPGVSYLRTLQDANFIQREAARKHLVIIGTSFIGMEVAAAMVETAASVTVIGRDRVPFLASLGDEVGKYIMSLHQQQGVQFCLEQEVAEFSADSEGRLEGVVLKTDRRLKADLVVIGVGVIPATDIAGVTLDQRGLVEVDVTMATGMNNVWAAGDIVKFPLTTYQDQVVNIGHWGLAMYLGKVAALNMIGKETKANTVPFFWTVQFGKSLRYAGLGNGWNSAKVFINEEEGKLLAIYCKDDVVCSVATLGRDPVAAEFANYVKSGRVLKADEAVEWCNNF